MPASDELPSYQFTPVCQRVHPEQRANVTYELILRQQPKQSRMCGVGEKADRRPIDPPPIVQLIVKAPPSSGGSKSNGAFTSYLQNPYYFMHASLVEKDTREDVLLIKDTRSKEDMQLFKDNRTKATTGSSVSSLYPLKDFEDGGTESGFFVFPDLSVRMEGTYRLKFCLYEMVGKDVHFCAFVISDPLVVYSAKKFPGMEESTQLSQYFAEQGLKIRIRKEVRPKKRSRGEYLTVPTSQSPTESQQRDAAELPESQDDEEKSTAATGAPQTSKRRASGIRTIEFRREKNAALGNKSEHPASQDTRGGQWGGSQMQERADYQDRSRPVPGAYGQQQPHHGHFEGNSNASRRFSAANRAAEGVSHMDLNAKPSSTSTRPDQRADLYRGRGQDQLTAVQEHGIPNPHLSRHGPTIQYYGPPTASRPSIEGQQIDQRTVDSLPRAGPTYNGPFEDEAAVGTTHRRHYPNPAPEYQDGSRRPSAAGVRRVSFPETPAAYSPRGMVAAQGHVRDHPIGPPYQADEHSRVPQSQPLISRATPSEKKYAYPRQGYTVQTTQKPMDYNAPASYLEDHHRGSVSSNAFDRPDYVPRSQVEDPSQHAVAFPANTQPPPYPPHPAREHLFQNGHPYPGQQRPAPQRPRRSSEYESFPGFQQQSASHLPYPAHSHPLPPQSRGKYPASDGLTISQAGPESNHAPNHTLSEEAVSSHGRYATYGHPPYPGSTPTLASVPAGHAHRDAAGGPLRESLSTSAPQAHDHRLQSMPQLALGPSLPPKTHGHSPVESAFHREREGEKVTLHLDQEFSGYPPYHSQDGASLPVSGSEASGHYVRGSSSVPAYTNHPRGPVLGMGQGTASRSGSLDYGHENRSSYGHGRSISSSGIPRPPYSLSTAAMPLGHTSGPGPQSSSPPVAVFRAGQGRKQGQYENYDITQGSHYTTAQSNVPNSSGPDSYGVHGSRRTQSHEYVHPAGPGPVPGEPGGSGGHGASSSHTQAHPDSVDQSKPQQQQHQHYQSQYHHQQQQQAYHAQQRYAQPQYQHHPEPMTQTLGPASSHQQTDPFPHAQAHSQVHEHGPSPLYAPQQQSLGSHGYNYGPSSSIVTQSGEAIRGRS